MNKSGFASPEGTLEAPKSTKLQLPLAKESDEAAQSWKGRDVHCVSVHNSPPKSGTKEQP